MNVVLKGSASTGVRVSSVITEDGPPLARKADGPRVVSSGDSGAVYLTVAAAALRLSTSVVALRARCRRHARREGRDIVARLGAGIVAYKIGASWRVRFPG